MNSNLSYIDRNIQSHFIGYNKKKLHYSIAVSSLKYKE